MWRLTLIGYRLAVGMIPPENGYGSVTYYFDLREDGETFLKRQQEWHGDYLVAWKWQFETVEAMS